MNIPTVDPVYEDTIARKSSIFQHSDILSVMKRGEWCPITFDVIDGVECRKVKSHKVTLRIRGGMNYSYPVGTCKYVKDTYFLTQKDKEELKVLPEWYGKGFYKSHERKNMLTNIGDSALANRQTKILRVGKDYVEAKTVLDPVE